MRGLIVSCSLGVSLFGSSFAQALEWPVCLQSPGGNSERSGLTHLSPPVQISSR